MKFYHFSRRIITLSGDVESNPGPTNEYCKSVSLPFSKAYTKRYMREYMKHRRADDNVRKNENKKRVQGSNINSKNIYEQETADC